MKNLFLLCISASLLFTSCKKDEGCTVSNPTTVASAAETAYLQTYLSANAISASSTHGMFYTISNPGSGTSPNLCNAISVNYTGVLINGTSDGAQFDATTGTPISLTLSRLIEGWQLVLPLLKTGGTVVLFIPPSLGYGSRANPGVPANSYLKFTITLVSVQ
ncbi:MAG: FKBP-type peptidyl-prolyl cis-trans isomerase [Ferruginibacter sp.]